jgi:Helicase HerA, central domain
VLLALRLPAGNERGPLYMDQALAAIHQANPGRLPMTFVLGRQAGAVTLCCAAPDELAAVVQAQLYAAYPECAIEWLPGTAFQVQAGQHSWVCELRLVPDLFPLKRYPQFEDTLNRQTADPLTSLLTALARQKGERCHSRIEITVRPARGKFRDRAQHCLRRLASPFFRTHPRLAHGYVTLACSGRWPLRLAGWCLGRLGKAAEQSSAHDPLHTSGSRAHEREEHLQAAADKYGRLLFETRIRIVVSGTPDAESEAFRRLRQVAGAFGIFHSPGLASFRSMFPRPRPQARRRPAPGFLLSTEELATLFHPPTLTVRAPALPTVDSREFEPPLALPVPAEHPGLAILGHAVYRGRRQRFGILPDDRFRHVLLLGKTGQGKSTLLRHLFASDLRAGRGCALIDPHGDLADAVLHDVPTQRTNDVILFDAGDAQHPVAFNILACDAKEQRPLVASGVVSAFKKLYADSWGPRLEHILRNALLALLETPGSSLISILRLLQDRTYRAGIADRLSDPAVRAFWQVEFANLPLKLQLEAIAPIQNKVGHFVSSPLLRNIVGQTRSTLDLRRVMDDGKVLIVNVGKGRVGDDASALLGSLLVTAIQLAAMARADTPADRRKDFFLYIDEFQNYATDSFATILSEARKYRLALTVANQYLDQLDDATLAAALGNVGTLAAFQVGAQDAEVIAEQLGGDVQAQDLLRLPRYHAYVRLLIQGTPSRPFSMQTLAPHAARRTPDRTPIIRRTSRQRYTRPAEAVEGEIAAAFIG